MALATQLRGCHALCNAAIHNWALYIMAVELNRYRGGDPLPALRLMTLLG